MIDVQDRPLTEFAHRGLVWRRDPMGRVLALLATALLFAALVALSLQGFAWKLPAFQVTPPATMVRLLPDAPTPRIASRDFTVHLIRPRPENAPMPDIVIKPDTSQAPRASWAASAARDTSIAGGAASGMGGAVSGVGTGGSGTGVSACIDPAYLDQILRHVRQWYDYPLAAGRATGVAYVHFVIDRSGHYKALNMAKGTGNAQLDAAAMWTMHHAEPLPPIPQRFHTDQVDGLMPIIYQIGQPLRAQQLGHAAGGC